MRRSARFVPLVLLSLAVGCVRPVVPPPPPPAPAPTPPPAPAPLPATADWRDWPLTPGTWSYRRDARGSLALFGGVGLDAAMTLRCDRTAGAVFLSFAGVAAPSAAAPSATVRTTSVTRAIRLQPTGGTPAYAAAQLGVRDPLLDALAFSRGRFVVERAGAAPLVVPAWAEIGRTIEDCR